MNLVLDEKNVRKGKPIGLPYVGSKKKISKKIAQIIAQNFGNDKPFYDLFGGGGAVSLEMMLNGFENVHYNDLDSMTFAAFKAVLYEDFDVRDLIISRKEFFDIRDKEHDGIEELKLLANSFGNDRKSYIYAKSFSDEKTELALKIVREEENWRRYKQTETYKQHNENKPSHLRRIQQIQQIEQIGRIQQVERIQRVDAHINVTNKDYKWFSELSGSLLYLDPPYQNATDKYKTGNFDSLEFYDWAYKMSKKNIVIISSYEISDERFEPVFEFKNARSTLNSSGLGNRTEKLFMVKAGL